MSLCLGPKQTFSRWESDALEYCYHDILEYTDILGSVHQNGYRPRWTFNLARYRHRFLWGTLLDSNYALLSILQDGASYETAEEALMEAERRIMRFRDALAEGETK